MCITPEIPLQQSEWQILITHYKKYVNLWPPLLVTERSQISICDLFVTKNRCSKDDGRKLKLTTFFLRSLVLRPKFWSLVASPDHVGIQRGKLMWHKIQPGPIQRFTWVEPINSAFYYFFPMNFLSASWIKPNIAAFLFLGHGLFVSTISFFLFFLEWVH